jgi:hypothetical protein
VETENRMLGERITGKILSEGQWDPRRVIKQGPCLVIYICKSYLGGHCVDWFLWARMSSCVPDPGAAGCLESQSQEN